MSLIENTELTLWLLESGLVLIGLPDFMCFCFILLFFFYRMGAKWTLGWLFVFLQFFEPRKHNAKPNQYVSRDTKSQIKGRIFLSDGEHMFLGISFAGRG